MKDAAIIAAAIATIAVAACLTVKSVTVYVGPTNIKVEMR